MDNSHENNRVDGGEEENRQDTAGVRERDKATLIFVNGEEKTTAKPSLNEADLIRFAFGENPPTGEFVNFNITYRKGPRNDHIQEFEKGEEVKIIEGMLFNVVPTDKS